MVQVNYSFAHHLDYQNHREKFVIGSVKLVV